MSNPFPNPYPFCLEVVKFNEFNQSTGEPARLVHVGYMKKMFRTRHEAVEYYDTNNPHLRSIKTHNTYMSDWDPTTRLAYIVRKSYGIDAHIPPFS